MWNRTELKARGKEAFKRNYWMCVLAGVLLMITTGGIGSFSYNMGLNLDMEDASAGFPSTEITNFIDQFISSKLIITVLSVTIIVALIVSLALSVLVFGPLEVGCCNFFKKNAYEKVGFEHVSVGFKKETYKNIVITMFLRNLYITLWSFLLLIPGIIKTYEYRMVPYILTDCPEIPNKEAFRISKEMMDGNKMEAFLLDFSFFGWIVLAIITCNITGIFYVYPYVSATDAELFIAIREEYFNKQKEAE